MNDGLTDEPINDAGQAAAFLLGLVLDDPRPYQSRAVTAQQAVRALLSQLGNPQLGLRCVHIAGSKGKGSTALLLEAVLLAAGGVKVGVFTSPHLQRWAERFRLHGAPVSDRTFARLVERLRPLAVRHNRSHPDLPVTFFDALTAAGLSLFAEHGVDLAIIETGLGGRLDATNVVTPEVTCITSIELEHTDKLGQTLAEIAFEKAGIIKPDVPVVAGPLPDAAYAVIAGRARELAAPLWAWGRDFELAPVKTGPADPHRFHYRDAEVRVDLSLPQTGQARQINAGLAITCARRLRGFDERRLRRGVGALATTQLPGRCEVLRQTPWLVVDGAHTVASARALREFVDGLPARNRVWVLSCAVHKDGAAIVAPLLRPGDQVVVTQADPLRSQPAAEIAAAIGGLEQTMLTAVEVIPDPTQALRKARTMLAATDVSVATGSVYMAGMARQVWALDGGPADTL